MDRRPRQSALTVRERQDLYAQLDDLEGDWLDAAEDVLEEILPEAFAVIKETCRRFIGKSWEAGGTRSSGRWCRTTCSCSAASCSTAGSVAEMKTGEGKTLTAVAPVYLNALVGRGVHVVTVNPYLAQRDAEWMAPIFGFHGLTVDCIDKHQSHTPGPPRAPTAPTSPTAPTTSSASTTSATTRSSSTPSSSSSASHHYAIVDEVDSVLIDEARTPLIISGPVPQGDSDQYQDFNPSVERLVA